MCCEYVDQSQVQPNEPYKLEKEHWGLAGVHSKESRVKKNQFYNLIQSKYNFVIVGFR